MNVSDQSESIDLPAGGAYASAAGEPPPDARPRISPQCAGKCGCRGTDAGDAPADAESFVYAIGRVGAHFPSLAAEKEFAQASGRSDTAGRTDLQAFQAVLSRRENRYLIRKLCWVLSIQGVDTYILVPRDPSDFDLLIAAIRPVPSPADIDVVV